MAGDGHRVGARRALLERKARWMLRNGVPADKDAAARKVVDVVLALIEMNNEAIADGMGRRDELGEDDF